MSYGPPCPGCGNDMGWKLGKDGEECHCGWPAVTNTSRPARVAASTLSDIYSAISAANTPTHKLPSKVVQISTMSFSPAPNNGEYNKLIVLCEDGSMWEQYHSSGYSNVPTDMLWHLIPS